MPSINGVSVAGGFGGATKAVGSCRAFELSGSKSSTSKLVSSWMRFGEVGGGSCARGPGRKW